MSKPASYNWRRLAPEGWNVGSWVRWLMEGDMARAKPMADEDIEEHLELLARCLVHIREYESTYGLPEKGGPKDQDKVLRKIVRDLYEGGTPLWALGAVMGRTTEGLTGDPNANWCLLPRKALIYSSTTGTTSMFDIAANFIIRKVDAMEKVAVRLASFASNTSRAGNLSSRFPNHSEFHMAQSKSAYLSHEKVESNRTKESLAQEILSLASESDGLFYFVNSEGYCQMEATRSIDQFWIVTDTEKELFTRLATSEAMASIVQLDKDAKTVLYPLWFQLLCQLCTSSGAAGIFFSGSWEDILAAGVLGVLLGRIRTWDIFDKQERVIFEVVVSFVIGFCAGVIALTFPESTCFTAIALSGLIEVLQGFRIVLAIMEVMSKRTVAGAADVFEAALFSALIAVSLQFGEFLAWNTSGGKGDKDALFPACTNAVNELWYILLAPIAVISWSVLFEPEYRDLPFMVLHGLVSYSLWFGLSKTSLNEASNSFVAALTVSILAGLISRFTGRNSVANISSGLYSLIPGAYLARGILNPNPESTLFVDILLNSILIGLGKQATPHHPALLLLVVPLTLCNIVIQVLGLEQSLCRQQCSEPLTDFSFLIHLQPIQTPPGPRRPRTITDKVFCLSFE